eukprot:jgi/Picsp_1/642/NSC_00638-R1_squamosa promoter binding protein
MCDQGATICDLPVSAKVLEGRNVARVLQEPSHGKSRVPEIEWDASDWSIDRYGVKIEPVEDAELTKNGNGAKYAGKIFCQVDGCNVDVQSLKKEYYIRYRVCDVHQKCLVALKDGKESRFCQQCGKFHPLNEFQGDKRSCKSRLEKHNARRRRLREMQLMLRKTGKIDVEVLKEKYGATDDELKAMEAKAKSQIAKKRQETLKKRPNLDRLSVDSVLISSDNSTCTDEKEFERMGKMSRGSSVHLAQGNSIAETWVQNAGQVQHTSACKPNVNASPLGLAEPRVLGPNILDTIDLDLLQDSYLDDIDISGVKVQPVELDKVAQMKETNGPLLGKTILDIQPEAVTSSPRAETWMFDEMLVPSTNHAMMHDDVCLGVPLLSDPLRANDGENQEFSSWAYASKSLAHDPSDARSHFDGFHNLSDVSTKMYGQTPADLPADMKPSIQKLMGAQAVESYMRPGCVHIQVDAILDRPSSSKDIRDQIDRFLNSVEPASIPDEMVLQFNDKMVVVCDGKVKQVLCTKYAGALLPSLSSVSRIAETAVFDANLVVELRGKGVNEDDTVLVRSRGKYLSASIASITFDEESKDQRILVSIDMAEPGALLIDVVRGAYTCPAITMVMTNSKEQAEELNSLITSPMKNARTFLYEVGGVMEAESKILKGECPTGIANALKDAPNSPARCAHSLLHFSIQRCWKHVVHAILEVLVLETEPRYAIELVEKNFLKYQNLSLLQALVRTKHVDLLKYVLEWAQSRNIELQSCRKGAYNLTSLHFAAITHDGGKAAALLTRYCPDACQGWEGAKAIDGASPIAFATRAGCRDNIEKSISCAVVERQYEVEMEESRPQSKEIWFRSSPEVDDRVSVALEECQEMDGLLNFKSKVLENKFKDWFNRGQVTVDLSFMFIAVISQAAWISKWDFHQSIFMFLAMTLLMVFNSISSCIAIFKQGTYVKYREGLCISSLLLHKVCQLIVSGMPGGGTIYLPSYSVTIALLESSSFAQVAMLTFGARPRFRLFLPTLAVVLALSTSLNKAICSTAFLEYSNVACQMALVMYQVFFCFVVPVLCVYCWEKSSRALFLGSMQKGKSS